MIQIMLQALLGGAGIALVAGPLGCFVVWRKMAYFGDTLAHSALLGVALGLMLEIQVNLAIGLCCALIALFLTAMQSQKEIATDTLLGILAHASLSIGLIAVSLMDDIRIDLTAYLFGDLLAISVIDLYWIAIGGGAVLLLMIRLWQPLLMMTVHEELARVEGIRVGPLNILLMLMFSLVIAISMKIIGVLLITSLLIIPAATARRLANTPEQMAILAGLGGSVAVCLGLLASYLFDTPAGPTVVVTEMLLFCAVYGCTSARFGTHS